MKNTIKTIKQRFDQGEILKFLFFWGHQPSKDGTITKSCLSQWWLVDFVVNGNTYKSAEHYMMVGKAQLFDPAMIPEILAAPTPAEAKKLGRAIQNFDPKVWDQHKINIVIEANYHKFSQNENLKKMLIKTQDRVLVEASPVDNIWGIGLTEQDEKARNPNIWQGENLLGFALMEVRDKLIS